MDYLEKFNDTMEEFIADLIQVFPNDTDMQMYQIAMKGIRFASPFTVCQEYHQGVTIPYHDKIASKDEDFFMTHDFSDVTKEVPDGVRILTKTMNYWKSLSDDDKNTVWKYLRVLCVLSKKICD